MSSAQHLREFIRERLTAAAQEIFTEVEKTIICYEEELDAQRRMMGINWKPEIKLHRVGSELQRQSSDLQQPSVSNEEEAPGIQQVWSLAIQSSQDQKEAEDQWTEEVQMEPEPKRIKKEENKPEPTLLNHEEIEYPLIYVRKEELDSSGLQLEQQPPEHLPTGQDQKDLCSSQEGEQLVQKEAEPRMMGINWKPQIKLHRIGSELQRQSSDLQQPSVSNEEEAFAIQQVCSLANGSSQDQKEAEHQWTEEEQMEPEPKWIKEEGKEPEPALLNHEQIEYPLKYVRKEELDSSVLQHEQQPPEHVPTGLDQKNLCSNQEREQLVQKQFAALIQTSTLQEDTSEEERTEQLSLQNSPVIESKNQEGSSSSDSESQAGTSTKKRSFKCDVCGICYTRQWMLKKHYRTHTGENISCETCGKGFSQICDLKVHKKIHTDLQQPSVSNEEEASAIKRVWSLASRSSQDQKEAEHQWTEEVQMEPEPKRIKKEENKPEPTLLKHEEIEYRLIYVRKEELDSSVLQHEQQPPEHLPTGQDQKNLCSSQEGEQLVQKQFAALIETSTLQEDDMNEEERRAEQLSLHISPVVERKDQEGSSSSVSESQSGTSTKKRSFKCDICGRCYTRQYKLKNHYKTHTGERRFSCEICGKSFSRSNILKCHKTTHTGERPFSCQLCGKRFSRRCNLKYHKRIHTGEKPFSCQSCGRSFTRSSHLNDHKKIHTGEKLFSCQSCGKRFTRSSTLNDHKKIHTGEGLFSCQSCGKSFCQMRILNRHKTIHTSEKPFPCQTCGRRFNRRDALNSHMKIHTGRGLR
ncbi:zinc finger protein 431-like isoform X3 [Xiphophorus hellerii]|uniref:zinc finger protein 431-like isoform X3 n=1 Tax=Xiphophorus hellerii TaxID=8084 RepID=UPI0013B469E5|nr:zinc finger protein 431-like isoform X3 [Xiphophorus hellerii]